MGETARRDLRAQKSMRQSRARAALGDMLLDDD